MPDSNPGLMTLFTEALERSDPAERSAYLDHACRGDAELRRRVEELLAAHPGIGRFLDPDRTSVREPTPRDTIGAFVPVDHRTVNPPSGDSATGAVVLSDVVTVNRPSDNTAVAGTFGSDAHRPKSLATGAPDPNATKDTSGNAPPRRDRASGGELGIVIAGRYTLVNVIGEGGMGSVYLATQSEPVRRQVGLKLIKAGMDSRAVLARFDAERQALALMDHPNIARVYDGGTTERGQPFFVMELVKGVTLTEYCDTQRLSIDARLQLFVSVCQAVQHAHQKGIIHRDLKPGNVLVTEVDGRPTPKVIDFGVAKATELKLTDMSLSDTGAIVGTPAYMSPERADPSTHDIDTRTDVYALGVMLYELLVGSPPIDARQFKRGAILEMLRMVREVEPPQPSTKLSTAEALRTIAANRNIEPGKLTKRLRGELDWVVMKALEKDRTRRDETANGLARDIERYLADEVVEARPPSRGSRLQKFVKRNKGQVSAACMVLLALVAGMAGTTWQSIRAERARAQAERQRQRAEVVNAFLVKDLLAQADPTTNPEGAKLTVRELLDKAARSVETSPSIRQNPEVEGAVRSAMGNTYCGLGLFERAREELERAIACQEHVPDIPASERFFTKNRLCWVIYKLGSFDETMARQLLEQARAELGPDHEQTVYATDTLATIVLGVHRAPEGLALLRENLATQQRVLGPEAPNIIRASLKLADGLMDNEQGDDPKNLDEALKVMLAVRDASRSAFHADHPERLSFELSLGYLYARLGKFAEAKEVLAPLREGYLKVFGPDHIDVALYSENLALAEEGLGPLDVAEALLRRSHAIRKSTMGPGHGLTRRAAANLGRVCMAQDKPAEAVSWLRVLLTEGVRRTGRLALPAGQPVPLHEAYWKDVRMADINLLDDALSGKGGPGPSEDLLHELHDTLRWISWKSDWLRAHVASLWNETRCRVSGLPKKEIADRATYAIKIAKESIQFMTADSRTPSRFLAETQARLKRLEELKKKLDDELGPKP